ALFCYRIGNQTNARAFEIYCPSPLVNVCVSVCPHLLQTKTRISTWSSVGCGTAVLSRIGVPQRQTGASSESSVRCGASIGAGTETGALFPGHRLRGASLPVPGAQAPT